MSLCYKINNNEKINQTFFKNKCNGKYSLTNKYFNNSQINTPSHKKTLKKQQNHSTFASFIQEHNQQLIQRNLNVELQTSQVDLRCFENNCINKTDYILGHKIQIKKHSTSQTLTSSNSSELSSSQHLPHQKDQSGFNTNTHRIFQEFNDEDYLIAESRQKIKQNITKSKQLSFSEVRSKLRQSKQLSDKYKNGKISLKRRNISNKYEQLNKQQILNNPQLQKPLYSGRQKANNITKSNLKVSIVVKDYLHLKDNLKANHQSDSNCQMNRRYVQKWINMASKSVVSSLKVYLVDERTRIQVDKDTPRTQKNKLFANPFYQQHLKEVLLCYASLRPEISYVQGMNFIASAIIFHTCEFSQSSRIFNFLMVDKQFEKIYQHNFQLIGFLSQHLCKQLEKYQPTLNNHINQCGVELQIFARGWYLSMFGAFVPLQCMHLIIDKFLRKGLIGLNQIMLALLLCLKQKLLEAEQDEVGMKLSNSWLAQEGKMINWQQIISCSDNLVLSHLSL